MFTEFDRERISKRTLKALAIRKDKHGVKLGNAENFSKEGRTKGATVMRENALIKNAVTSELIQLYRNDERMTFEQIAIKLNSLNHATPRGKKFSKSTVKIMYDRIMNPV